MRVVLRPASLLVVLLLVTSGVLTGCAATPAAATQSGGTGAPAAGMGDMPAAVQSAPVTVQQAYRFAVANPTLLQQVPCYCGCGAMGHTSNYSCYISGQDASGKLTFDDHALGCSICVDITQDVMRLSKQGKSVADIRTAVDAKYSQYGPSNMK